MKIKIKYCKINQRKNKPLRDKDEDVKYDAKTTESGRGEYPLEYIST